MPTAQNGQHHGVVYPASGLPSLWGGPVQLRRRHTDRFNNDVSTRDTIVQMRRIAHEYARTPCVQGITADAVRSLRPGAGHRDIAGAIHYWMRRNIRFIEDETLLAEQFGIPLEDLDKELLIVPDELACRMPVPQGDCDDYAMLGASMCICAGLRPYWVTIAADAAEPRRFSHIYICVELRDEGTHLCIDAGNRFQTIPPGWEARAVTRKAIWAV